MTTVLIVIGGALAAILASLLLAYILHSQRLHFQINALRRVFHRGRDPWAEEDAAWEHLHRTVQGIPDDLLPPSHDKNA